VVDDQLKSMGSPNEQAAVVGGKVGGDTERFGFGENWFRFLKTVDAERIRQAERSLQEMLGKPDLAGKTFLDAGCGSGLFSLAAVRLGAERVRSFDVDVQSVACAQELRRRFAEGSRWEIDQGNILSDSFVDSLGSWDIVYSWGVLHHTGEMWRALDRIGKLVAPGGNLFVSIYNDQGFRSRVWRRVKRTYNRLPPPLRTPYALAVMLPRELLSAGVATAVGRPGDYIRSWTGQRKRGMSRWHDLIDWVGGYPFEVARPEEIFDFFYERGFVLRRLRTCGGGLGCNEFVFERAA
jgi:2-polyprenyl-3-methyl-5-hydroxy-6-metoxy-1,4-benzoquinol methylase